MLKYKNVAVIPFYDSLLNNVIFEPLCYSLWKKGLADMNINLETIDKFSDLNKVDLIVSFDVVNSSQKKYQEIIKGFNGKKIIYLFECPVVVPKNYDSNELKKYDYVATWNNDLLDNKRFFRSFFPLPVATCQKIVPFSEKKMLSMIVGNKSSSEKNELYTERRKAIRFFGKKLGNQFDLYGVPTWTNCFMTNLKASLKGFVKFDFLVAFSYWGIEKTYRGGCDDKIETLSKYRFSVCYENMKNIKGYITEKIFDCFHAGTVPIYWGAENVTDYIPKECFIDRRDFSSYEDLLDFLREMNKETYNQYIENIKKFTKSDAALAWGHEAWGRQSAELINYLLSK